MMESQYIQVGNIVINPAQINWVEIEEKSITLFMSGGYQREFSGDEAHILRTYFTQGRRVFNLSKA